MTELDDAIKGFKKQEAQGQRKEAELQSKRQQDADRLEKLAIDWVQKSAMIVMAVLHVAEDAAQKGSPFFFEQIPNGHLEVAFELRRSGEDRSLALLTFALGKDGGVFSSMRSSGPPVMIAFAVGGRKFPDPKPPIQLDDLSHDWIKQVAEDALIWALKGGGL